MGENNNKKNDNDDETNKDESKILDVLSTITDNLDTYQGRDTAITLLHYIALIIADFCVYFSLPCSSLSENFVNMYIALSNCRVCLRLFDDFSAIREFYRFKKNESQLSLNYYLKWLNIINLSFWVLYNPFEKLAWFSELKIFNSNEQLWWFYTNFCWAGGLFTSVLLNLRVVYLYSAQPKIKEKDEDNKKYNLAEMITESQMKTALVIAARDFADFFIAVHYLPEGFLWSSRLYYYQIGLLGVFSSICRVPTYILYKQD